MFQLALLKDSLGAFEIMRNIRISVVRFVLSGMHVCNIDFRL